MGLRESLFFGFSVVGSVALFILGLGIMTEGLRGAAGDRIRWILFRATRNRWTGVGFGTLFGFVAQSTAASVMTVGFVNAGLMALRNSIPLLMGASIGTTLAMQLISFRLSEYAFAAIAVGFLLQVALPWATGKNLGRALLGFGLLFLGLEFVTNSIEPHRELFVPWLARIDGTTWSGALLGVLIAIAVTAAIQSSGATIGILFALISAGVFTSLDQVYPAVLGANIGTAGTALFVSIGANLEARRTALANLLFQVFNVALALLLGSLLTRAVALLGGDLVRQTANYHTAVMVLAAALLLPLLPFWVRFVYLIKPAREESPTTTYLDPGHLPAPERAIVATLRELGRAVGVCRESYNLVRESLIAESRKNEKRVRLNEGIINEIKEAVKDYLAVLTRRYLSRRQALMVQHLDRIIAHIERIGDHIESIQDIRLRQRKLPTGAFSHDTLRQLKDLTDEADKVLQAVDRSLAPETPDFTQTAEEILAVRDRYDECSLDAKRKLEEAVAGHRIHPLSGLFFSEYASALDRIVKHCKMIALEQKQPHFRIKEHKLERIAGKAVTMPSEEKEAHAKD